MMLFERITQHNVGDSYYSIKADIYSFGMIIYEIITYRLPYGNVLSKNIVRRNILEGVFLYYSNLFKYILIFKEYYGKLIF